MLGPRGAQHRPRRVSSSAACLQHAAAKLVELLLEIDDFDVDCVFRGGESGEYCTTNYRRIWPGREDAGLGASGGATERAPERKMDS